MPDCAGIPDRGWTHVWRMATAEHTTLTVDAEPTGRFEVSTARAGAIEPAGAGVGCR